MHKNFITFKNDIVKEQQALILVFDLQDFSKFFSQPDVHLYVATYLNKVFEAMDIIINGGKPYWRLEEKAVLHPFRNPTHVKFLGDGGLYIWTFSAKEQRKIKNDLFLFCNHIYDFKNFFGNFLDNCIDEIPVMALPKKIRFGIVYGTVYKLSYSSGGSSEYIGYCINLAARLQSYCKDLGFIISARMTIPAQTLGLKNYKKVAAKKLRGLVPEYVYVDKDEYAALSDEVKNELFEEA